MEDRAPHTPLLGAALGLTLLCLALYANGLDNAFTLDDRAAIVQNPLVQSLSNTARIFQSPYWTRYRDLYRPLTVWSYAINQAFSASPFWFRLVNVYLHIGCCWCVLLLAWRLFGGVRVATFAAALFAAHAIHVEAVTSIVGRAELLGALFSLLALCLLDFSRAGAAGLFLLGLLSKESALPTLALVALIDLQRPQATPRSVLRQSWPFLVALGLYFALRHHALGGFLADPASPAPPMQDNPLYSAAWTSRLCTALGLLPRALGLLLAPVRLSCDYSYSAIPVLTSPWNAWTLSGGALLVGACALFVAAARSRSPLAIAAALFLAPYLLISNLLLPIGTIFAERLLYAPSAGFCLLAAAGIDRLLPHRLAAWIALASICLPLGLRTIARNRDWRDNFSLYSSALEVVPDSSKMLHNLGNEYRLRGQYPDALRLLLRAVEIYPTYGAAYYKLGLVYQSLGKDPQALDALEKAIRYYQPTPEPHLELARIYERLKRPDAMEKHARLALGLAPGSIDALELLGAAQSQQGRLLDAAQSFQRAVDLEPGHPHAAKLRELIARLTAPAPAPRR